MATGDQIAAHVDSSTKDRVEEFRDSHGYENNSKAANELIRVGLREKSNPLVYRVKNRLVDWVSLLGIAAVIVFVAGATTGVMSTVAGAKLAIALVGAAVLLLAGFELLRVTLGMNEVGSVLREVFGGESA